MIKKEIKKKNSKSKDCPLISIIIPVYNTETFLPKTLESIIKQTEKSWEIILIDDCSTDKSLDIIKKFCKENSKARYFQNKQNLGILKTREKGFEHSKGKYIYFLDSDDVLYLNTLQLLVDGLSNGPDVIASYGRIIIVNTEGKILQNIQKSNKKSGTENLAQRLLIRMELIPGCILLKKESITKSDFINVENGEDWIFFAQIAQRGLFYRIEEGPIIKYRIHQKQYSNKVIDLSVRLKTLDLIYNNANITKRYPISKLRNLKAEAKTYLILYHAKILLNNRLMMQGLYYLLRGILQKKGISIILKNIIKKK